MNVLGIDIGGTTTKVGVVAMGGEVLDSQHFATAHFDNAQALAEACWQWLQASGHSIAAIGIGAPNGNYYKGTIEFAPNLRWKGIVPLSTIFSQRFSLPCFVTNDANAAAISEQLYGAARGLRDYLVVTLGTGLGSGFVANGELIYGHDGFAGELGHCIVVRGGRECGCGRQGCLETYASATGVVRSALEWLHNTDQPSILRQIPEDQLDSAAVAQAAHQGDALARSIFDQTGDLLGFALANAVAIMSPAAIIFFGGLAQAGDLLLTPTRRSLEANLLPIFQNKIDLRLSTVPASYAAILGAAALAFSELR